MFYSVKGKLIHTESSLAVVECAGVGYACRTTFNTLQAIAGKDEVMLLTYLAVREDAMELFGFATSEELQAFKMLISVSGIGPKVALDILSSMSPSSFALAVATGDIKAISAVKGIGVKKAERIALELRDKISKETISARGGRGTAISITPAAGSAASEAINALMVLGFTQGEAASAVSKLDPSLSVEDMIKLALKNISGK